LLLTAGNDRIIIIIIAPPGFCAVGKMSEHFLLVQKVSSKNAKFGPKKTHFAEILVKM